MRGLGWPLTRGIGQWQPARTLTTAPISSSEGWNIIGDNISQVLMAQNTIPISRCEFQGYYHCLTFWPSLLQIVVFGILKGYKPQYHHHGVLVPEQQAAALCPCGSFVHTWKKQGRAPLRSWPASPCQVTNTQQVVIVINVFAIMVVVVKRSWKVYWTPKHEFSMRNSFTNLFFVNALDTLLHMVDYG